MAFCPFAIGSLTESPDGRYFFCPLQVNGSAIESIYSLQVERIYQHSRVVLHWETDKWERFNPKQIL